MNTYIEVTCLIDDHMKYSSCLTSFCPKKCTRVKKKKVKWSKQQFNLFLIKSKKLKNKLSDQKNNVKVENGLVKRDQIKER
jgi:hypothetical protein